MPTKILLLLTLLSIHGMTCGKPLQQTQFKYGLNTLPRDSSTNRISFDKEISLTEDRVALLKKALKWFDTSYKSPQNFIQLADTTNGKIVLKGILHDKLYDLNVDINHSVIIYIEDSLARIQITNLSYLIITKEITFEQKESELISTGKSNSKRFFAPWVKNIKSVLTSFEAYMSAKGR